jgi:hypothetical protein
MYERFMLTLVNNLFKMLSFFASVQISVVKDMVHEDVVMFQNIWEETNEK